jgi:flagellar hook-length control protein FliK
VAVAEVPVAPAAPAATPAVESPVAPAAPVAKSSVVESPAAPVVEAPVAKSELASARPVVAGKRTAAPEEVVVIDLSQESARAAAPLREAPFVAAAQQEIVASTASARTEAIVEVVNNVAEAIADQILVTPSLVRGEGQMIVRLKPEVLDGSEIRLSSESGTLAVEVVPSTPNAAKLATEAMPRLETALAEHVSAFRKISVSVRKGKGNEII